MKIIHTLATIPIFLFASTVGLADQTFAVPSIKQLPTLKMGNINAQFAGKRCVRWRRVCQTYRHCTANLYPYVGCWACTKNRFEGYYSRIRTCSRAYKWNLEYYGYYCRFHGDIYAYIKRGCQVMRRYTRCRSVCVRRLY